MTTFNKITKLLFSFNRFHKFNLKKLMMMILVQENKKYLKKKNLINNLTMIILDLAFNKKIAQITITRTALQCFLELI